MMRRPRIIPALALLFALPLLASAHVTGASFEKTVDGYLVDSGYSNPAPSVGESVLFDFRLRKGQTDVPFTDVWVKVEDQDKNVVFASGLYNADYGGPRMSYVFPRAGNYTIDIRYEDKSGPIVETSYPITVIPASSGGPLSGVSSYVFLGLGVLIGAGIAFAMRYLKPKKKAEAEGGEGEAEQKS